MFKSPADARAVYDSIDRHLPEIARKARQAVIWRWFSAFLGG